MSGELPSIVGIVAAAIGGLAVGVERERTGHASGPHARFAGVRTFALLGGVAGMSGWLWAAHYEIPATVLLAGAVALVVAAYVAASRREVEGTTEVAGLVVLAAGWIAGMSQLTLASGIIAVTVLALVEKSRLHGLVARLHDEEIRAGARFAVMAVVILPLLPTGPYGPFGGVRPRELWVLVLLFAGLSFVGYIARRIVGASRGYAVAGLLGGLISSTSVAITFARASRGADAPALPLASGVIAASTMLFVRVLLASAILNQTLALALAPYLLAPFCVGLAVTGFSVRSAGHGNGQIEPPTHPLQFSGAVQMGLLFQVVLFVVYVMRQQWGESGLLASGAVFGLTDLDALVISMAKAVGAGVPGPLVAHAIVIGTLSNTAFKLTVTGILGRGSFRRLTAGGLALMGVACTVSLALLW